MNVEGRSRDIPLSSVVLEYVLYYCFSLTAVFTMSGVAVSTSTPTEGVARDEQRGGRPRPKWGMSPPPLRRPPLPLPVPRPHRLPRCHLGRRKAAGGGVRATYSRRRHSSIGTRTSCRPGAKWTKRRAPSRRSSSTSERSSKNLNWSTRR